MSQPAPRVMMVHRSFIVSGGKILAVQRAATDRNNPFKWEIPGGKHEEDQTLADTLAREVQEETGLTIRPIPDIFHREQDVLQGGQYHDTPRITLVGICRAIGGMFVLSEEHDDHRWCRYQEFLRLDLTDITRNAARALQHDLRKAGVYGVPASPYETALIA